MPLSMKRLHQRYQSVCGNIADAKDYTIQHLTRNIQMDIEAFYENLGGADIEGCEEYLCTAEETIQQCKVAVRNEKSRRALAYEIQRKMEEQQRKMNEKEGFKLTRRVKRLQRATPYHTQRQASMTDSESQSLS